MTMPEDPILYIRHTGVVPVATPGMAFYQCWHLSIIQKTRVIAVAHLALSISNVYRSTYNFCFSVLE